MQYRLEEIFDLQMGKTPARNNPEYWNTQDNKWISISDLSKCEKYISDTKEYISDKAVEESGIKSIPENTVIMSFKLSIGKTAITPEPMYSNEAIMAFIDKKIVELLPDYIYYMLLSRDWNDGTNKAVMGKTLNKATLSKVKVSIHSIEEQKKIIKVLDRVQSIITHRKQQLEKLDLLIKARFVEMFGDPVCNTKHLKTKKGIDIFKLSNGKFVPEDKRFDSGIPAYGGNGISWYTNDILFQKDTLVIGRVGFQSGNVHFAKAPLWITDNAMYISNYDNQNYDIKFLCDLIEHIDFTRYQDAGDLKKITQKPFMNMEFIAPSIEMQKQYVSFVQQVDKSKAVLQRELEKAQMLFDSLMQEYFG